jgi:hypothetical protein
LTEASKLFGFVQLDLAGALPLADGRYVVRDDGEETVLVVETLAAPAPPRRRRRRPQESDANATPATLPLARVTVIRATDSFTTDEDATRWLEATVGDEAAADTLVANGVATLNRALHVHAVVSGDPHQQAVSSDRAAAIRVGYGRGEQVANGEWTTAREIDVHGGASPRQRREESLRPQERTAAILGDREQLDACETLLLRARADLDSGRTREAALQLRIALDALLAELPDAVDDPSHSEDMATLESRRKEATAAADSAIQGDLDATRLKSVEDLTALCERILRRRRVLGDGG